MNTEKMQDSFYPLRFFRATNNQLLRAPADSLATDETRMGKTGGENFAGVDPAAY
jgi:hypothetical protein